MDEQLRNESGTSLAADASRLRLLIDHLLDGGFQHSVLMTPPERALISNIEEHATPAPEMRRIVRAYKRFACAQLDNGFAAPMFADFVHGNKGDSL